MKVVGSTGSFTVLFISLLALAGCRHTRIPSTVPASGLPESTIPLQNSDSIALLSVKQTHGHGLERGQPAEMTVTIQYTLATRDSAILKLSLDQFPNRESCISPSEGSGASAPLTLAVREVAVSRGTHELMVPVTWPGDTGDGTDGRIFGAGAVSFHASMRTDHPDYEFLIRRFGTEYCMRF